MDFMRRHIVSVSTLIGALAGYFIVHPVGVIAHEFFHVDEGVMHFQWQEIAGAAVDSFHLSHIMPAMVYVLLTAAMGFLVGKIVNAYQVINEQVKLFSEIGANAASVVHDLNSPIATIEQNIRLLKMKDKEGRYRDSYERVERQTAKLAGMVSDIKIKTQDMRNIELRKEETELGPFIKSILDGLNIRSKTVVDSSLDKPVPVDKRYFERVMWNLIKNADEALDGVRGARIDILIREQDDLAVICIQDNGPGIPRKELEHIFDLGWTTGKKAGTGIGLYNCKKIIEAHGGDIRVSSEPGEGTSVCVRISRRV
ncbi:MAG: GHKL domain-containing protein [Candidatus Omnitrophica bacterium]|nr:GHKL domain-containing protein [Candidatus Omnitrophota bacterium]